MDTIEWYRFFTSLTEAASTESHLTLGRLSCTNLLRAGTRILEGWDLHRDGPHEAEDAALQADMNEERRESEEVSGTRRNTEANVREDAGLGEPRISPSLSSSLASLPAPPPAARAPPLSLPERWDGAAVGSAQIVAWL